MRKSPVIFAMIMGASLSYGTTSSNTIEGSIQDAASAKEDAPFNLSLKTSYESNPFEIHKVEVNEAVTPLYEDVIIQTISASKEISLGNIGNMDVTYTPSLSASILDSKAEEEKDDTVKSADINNNLTLSAESGSVQYGLKLDANYHSSYSYKYRNRVVTQKQIDENTDPNVQLELGAPISVGFQKRYNNNANAAIGTFANLGVTDNWLIENSLSLTYFDHFHARNPHYRAVKPGVHQGYASGLVGDTYDRMTTAAGITNKFILNDNLNVEVPLSYSTTNFSDNSAYTKGWDGDDSITRLTEETTIGMTLNATIDTLTASFGGSTARINDKRRHNIEDADHNFVNTSLSYAPVENISMAASHVYEEVLYDYEPEGNNERYNTYSFGVTYSTEVMGTPLATTLAHGVSKGQSQFPTGIYENNATSLDLSFQL